MDPTQKPETKNMKIRINNIGVRPPTYIGKQPENAKHTLSIVQYYTAFNSEELCIVIAYITYDTDECVTDLKSVGERILNLSEDDRKDFFEAYKIATNKMKEIFKEQ